MHVLLVSRTVIPVFAYGGTERVIWDLGRALVAHGHQVTYLVLPGSSCDFASVLHLDDKLDLRMQIPADVDLVHFHFKPDFGLDTDFDRPYVCTEHGNSEHLPPELPLNSVFVSQNHAERHGSHQYVYNGLDWNAYGAPCLEQERGHYHFLGKGAWRVKNLTGAIDVALRAGETLEVLGANRLNFKRGFRFTWSPRIHFHGMVGGPVKQNLLRASKGLIFPVRWHEPFGLAVIESLYFGCPVFATPYGALPELVTPETGVLAAGADALAEAVRTSSFDRRACHLRVKASFDANTMAAQYVRKYEAVMDGAQLNAAHPVMDPKFKDLAWGR